MENTPNDRVIALLKTLKIDEVEASQRIGKNSSTLYRITGKSNSPTKSTLKLIASSLGANYNWLLTGHGEMFLKDDTKADNSNIAKALVLLEEQLKKKDEQIAQFMKIFAKVNFHNAIENTLLPEIYFPGQHFDSVRANA